MSSWPYQTESSWKRESLTESALLSQSRSQKPFECQYSLQSSSSWRNASLSQFRTWSQIGSEMQKKKRKERQIAKEFQFLREKKISTCFLIQTQFWNRIEKRSRFQFWNSLSRGKQFPSKCQIPSAWELESSTRFLFRKRSEMRFECSSLFRSKRR